MRLWNWRKDEPELSPDDEAWAELLMLAQHNQLALARFALVAIEDPEIVTEEMREELLLMVRDLEDGLAVMEEWCAT